MPDLETVDEWSVVIHGRMFRQLCRNRRQEVTDVMKSTELRKLWLERINEKK